MPESIAPVPAAASPAPAAAPVPLSRAAAVQGMIDAAAKSFAPVEAAASAPDDATPSTPAPLPSTPDAPATQAALEATDSASALIRQKHELADARKALIAERAAWSKEQAEHKQRLAQMERAFQDFERDPAGFVKAGGGKRSLMEYARDLYIEDAEIDKLPPEQAAPLKAERELMRLRREQAKMQAELAQTNAEHRLALYRTQLSAGLSSLGDDTPLVRALAANDPQMVVAQMERMAMDLAVKRPDLGAQTSAQLAALLEPQLLKQLEDTSSRFKNYFERKFGTPIAPAPAAAVPPTPAAAPKKPAEPTLSRDLQASTPARSGALSLTERMAKAALALDGKM